jgi:ribosome-binding protein aMBF1 (putative translation factor)
VVLFYYYKVEKKKEVITLEVNWDEILNELLEKSRALIESKEVVRDARIKAGLSLSELSEMLGIPETDLADFENGHLIESTNEFKIFMWFFEKEGRDIQGRELRENFRLAYLRK